MAKAPIKKPQELENAQAEVAMEETAPVTQQRIYKGTQVLDHDLFKLKVAKMRKDVSYDGEPDYVQFEHCHIFHTIDSNGKKQDTCSPVGGHFHEVRVVQKPGQVPTLEVSGPMKYVMKKFGKKFKKVPEPLDPEVDSHTHEVEYLGSERITPRTPNMEFAKLDAAVRAHQSPTIENVREG